MVARREALGRGFDEDLSLGEDVDLVWRLHDVGWQVRYDPRTRVAHRDRVEPWAWYRRRVAYNESVAPLLVRHPERLPALFVSPPAALGWGAALAGAWPVLAMFAALRAARPASIPPALAAATVALGTGFEWWHLTEAQTGALAGVRFAEGFVVREPVLRAGLFRDGS